MTWKLTIGHESLDGVTVLRVTGRLGTSPSGGLIDAINDAIQTGSRRLLLDLTGVDYASSAGLMSLDAVSGLMHVARGTLVLCGLTAPVRLALELSGLLPNFVIESSPAAAMSRLRAFED